MSQRRASQDDGAAAWLVGQVVGSQGWSWLVEELGFSPSGVGQRSGVDFDGAGRQGDQSGCCRTTGAFRMNVGPSERSGCIFMRSARPTKCPSPDSEPSFRAPRKVLL
jgi:hypothetical protein